MTDTAIFLFCAVVVHPAPPVCERMRRFSQKPQNPQIRVIGSHRLIGFLRFSAPYAVEEEFLAEPAEPADSGDWLTQINWISKIFCAVCERKRSFSQNPQKSQKKIINLLNQINLSETHIPFCGICAICERKRNFSQKPRKSQKKIINLLNQINL